MQNNELAHHGILGMRWGVRRYQNKDGSLTAAGKKRVAKLDAEREEITGKKTTEVNNSGQNGTKKSSSGISLKKLSDEELAERINRNRLEKAYVDSASDIKRSKNALKSLREADKVKEPTEDDILRSKTDSLNAQINYLTAQQRLSQLQPEKVSMGKKIMSTVMSDVIAPAAKSAGKQYLEKMMKEKLGINTEDALSALKKEVDTIELKKRKAVAEDYFEKRNKKKNNNDDQDTSNNTTKNDPNKKKNTTTKDDDTVYEGTVEGAGNSRNSSNNQKSNKSSDYYDPIDGYGEWVNESMNSSTVTSLVPVGRNYVEQYLLEERYR